MTGAHRAFWRLGAGQSLFGPIASARYSKGGRSGFFRGLRFCSGSPGLEWRGPLISFAESWRANALRSRRRGRERQPEVQQHERRRREEEVANAEPAPAAQGKMIGRAERADDQQHPKPGVGE